MSLVSLKDMKRASIYAKVKGSDIDDQIFNELILLQGYDEPNFVGSLLELYIETTDVYMKRLGLHICDGDLNVKYFLDRISEGSMHIGAVGVELSANVLKTVALSGDVRRMKLQYKELLESYTSIRCLLLILLKKKNLYGVDFF